MTNSEPSAPGSAERVRIPKVEVSFNPLLEIPHETGPGILAVAKNFAASLNRFAGVSSSASPRTLSQGEEDHAGTLLSGVEVRIDGDVVFMTPKVLVPVIGGKPRRYQWASYYRLPVLEGRLVVPSDRSSDVVLALLIERANENPGVQALLSSL